MDSLHPYDGKERRFRNTDKFRRLRQGHKIARNVLGLADELRLDGVEYDMSFFSGGIGIIDKLSIRLACSLESADTIIDGLHFAPLAKLLANEDTRSEVSWLIGFAGQEPDAVRFLNEHRADFLALAEIATISHFAPGSGVNDWAVAYYGGGALNYIGYSQG